MKKLKTIIDPFLAGAMTHAAVIAALQPGVGLGMTLAYAVTAALFLFLSLKEDK